RNRTRTSAMISELPACAAARPPKAQSSEGQMPEVLQWNRSFSLRCSFMPVGRPLVCLSDGEHDRLAQSGSTDFQADRHSVAAESTWNRDARQAVDIKWLCVAKRGRYTSRWRRSRVGDG